MTWFHAYTFEWSFFSPYLLRLSSSKIYPISSHHVIVSMCVALINDCVDDNLWRKPIDRLVTVWSVELMSFDSTPLYEMKFQEVSVFFFCSASSSSAHTLHICGNNESYAQRVLSLSFIWFAERCGNVSLLYFGMIKNYRDEAIQVCAICMSLVNQTIYLLHQSVLNITHRENTRIYVRFDIRMFCGTWDLPNADIHQLQFEWVAFYA